MEGSVDGTAREVIHAACEEDASGQPSEEIADLTRETSHWINMTTMTVLHCNKTISPSISYRT